MLPRLVNLNRPESRSSSTGPLPCTWMTSPGLKWFFAAVPVSIATWFLPGQLPLVRTIELKRGCDGSTEKPMCGAPP